MDSNDIQHAEAAETKSRLVKSAAYYAAFIILGLTGAVIGPTLPRLAEHTRTQLRVAFCFRLLHSAICSVLSWRAGCMTACLGIASW
jgi:hypothetical protein